MNVNTVTEKTTRNPVIFDIQRFSLHDGPGIRTTIFFKGCSLRCLWCQNPESQSFKPEISFYEETCAKCFNCEAVCKESAVSSSNFRIIYDKCTSCGDCVKACTTNSLRLIGKPLAQSTVIEKILEDKDYYIDSGGGVTFSGGEPLLFDDYVLSLCKELKKSHIHIVIETCGHVRWKAIENLIPYVDIFFYDLKLMDNKQHKSYTGQDVNLIRNNFKALSESKANVVPRIPIIPGINDSNNNIFLSAQLLKEYNHHMIHLLPYHRLGVSKLKRLNRNNETDIEKCSTENMERLKKLFSQWRIETIVYE